MWDDRQFLNGIGHAAHVVVHLAEHPRDDVDRVFQGVLTNQECEVGIVLRAMQSRPRQEETSLFTIIRLMLMPNKAEFQGVEVRIIQRSIELTQR